MSEPIKRGSRKFCQGGQKFYIFFALVIIFYKGERGSVPIFLTSYHWLASETFHWWAVDGVIFQGWVWGWGLDPLFSL